MPGSFSSLDPLIRIGVLVRPPDPQKRWTEDFQSWARVRGHTWVFHPKVTASPAGACENPSARRCSKPLDLRGSAWVLRGVQNQMIVEKKI